MHYSAMAAAQLPLGAVCGGLDGLSGDGLVLVVSGMAALMLGAALLTSMYDARHQAREARLSKSLRVANDQLHNANLALQQLAFRDALTGLPNRLLFDDRLRHAVARLARAEAGAAGALPERLAVLFIDLDGFKPVNDSLGHAAGDQVLKEVARRLQSVARSSDTLARLGGDEFVMLLEGVAGGADAASTAAATAQRLIAMLQQPFALAPQPQLQPQPVLLSCSVGMALYPDHGDADKLLACADAAMYAAKRGGGSTLVMFEPGMAVDAGGQVALQLALRGAIERQELSLHYQPKINAASGALQGLEALLRWRDLERGMVSPALFIPVAERFGLIGAIGSWVIDEACAQLGRWQQQGWTAQVAINLSPHQLRQPDLPDRIQAALARHQLAPAQLVCEITETAMMDNLQDDQLRLGRLAALGVGISIDDFGTGYSSLAYLRRLPARQLKIDRSFVQDVDSDDDARAVFTAVVQLAHALRMGVVAEGVETLAQREVLTAMGCDQLQGFLLARPMPADAVMPWRAAWDAALVARAEPLTPAAAAVV
jgi:diguanylate cyclase (GGDEF)-like protein